MQAQHAVWMVKSGRLSCRQLADVLGGACLVVLTVHVYDVPYAQGTDVRLSGHFVYATLPGFKDGPPVRCTNRVKVGGCWLDSCD